MYMKHISFLSELSNTAEDEKEEETSCVKKLLCCCKGRLYL